MIFLMFYLEMWVDQFLLLVNLRKIALRIHKKTLWIKNLNAVIISQININAVRNKIELLSEAVLGNIDILMVSGTKIDMLFPSSQLVIQGFAAPFRLDRTNTGEGILVYVWHDIPSKLMNIPYVSSDTECLAILVNLHKTK